MGIAAPAPQLLQEFAGIVGLGFTGLGGQGLGFAGLGIRIAGFRFRRA